MIEGSMSTWRLWTHRLVYAGAGAIAFFLVLVGLWYFFMILLSFVHPVKQCLALMFGTIFGLGGLGLFWMLIPQSRNTIAHFRYDEGCLFCTLIFPMNLVIYLD